MEVTSVDSQHSMKLLKQCLSNKYSNQFFDLKT